MHCRNCNKKGHTVCYCKAPTQPISQIPTAGGSQACYECGEIRHFKRNCPKTKNDFCPKTKNDGDVGRILAIVHEEAMADPNVVTGTFLLSNSYECILFDSVVEKSFVSHKFKHLLKQNPQTLKDTFIVEMANGKTKSKNDIYIGCTLTLKNYSFQIDLMPVSIKSFDIITNMDRLSLHHANILCFERAIHLNLPSNESLVIYGDKSGANLQIISCVKANKYLRKYYCSFLAHVVDKTQEVKIINDILEVYNFPDVFPKDISGVPPERQGEF
ncbi:uncharacterized protein LOC111907958 [Lactuca sativa]|uniref:uncharacterized protein LOC111907958 n=1 Tax=Lactuca sativa TaxID=4236 RepID=UPI000CD8C5CE|nr:uncharacterized protein LOC111907958 [Lactuca sativa]